MPKFRTLDNISVAGKRVLVRCDLNVPMKDGKVTDATRIERSAETLKELSGKGAKVDHPVAFRPAEGQARARVFAETAGRAAGKALGRNVAFVEDCIGPVAEQAVKALKDGDVLLLENLRFHAGEEKPTTRASPSSSPDSAIST